ncbi:hypothetical protein WN55_07165 [Dufourea novaeangliae]|uniref:LITAF domain-containing protein n=2 Tax=Dufourea novaeangliae TaxID=178035 RepID=A0A154P2B4_DUFNO|nr:hypothetical protein WN55_07165 [Dufourea novaeangliae]
MEKSTGFASGSTQPSAPPPPTAPPSYEEAIGNVANLPTQPNIPPYPVGPSCMPVPSCNQPTSQTVPQYAGKHLPGNPLPSDLPPQTVPQYPRNHIPGHSLPSDPPDHFPENPPPSTYNTFSVPSSEAQIYVLGPNPIKMTCPTCHSSIKTTTISDHQPAAHICCIVLCLLG